MKIVNKKSLQIGFVAAAMMTIGASSQAACVVDENLKSRILSVLSTPRPNVPDEFSSKVDEVFNFSYYTLKNNLPNPNHYPKEEQKGIIEKNIDYWFKTGICAGHESSPTFSINSYKNYADLRAAFNDNNWAYLRHFFDYGAAEGRCATSDNEIPTQVYFNNNLTVASYPMRGNVYSNNAQGGLVIKNPKMNGGSHYTPCTGRMPNFSNVGNTVQTIRFQFAGNNFFNNGGGAAHIGVLGNAKAYLASDNNSLGGYNATGLIFWANSNWSGAEAELFSAFRVSQRNSFAQQELERAKNGNLDITGQIYDTFDPWLGSGQYYQATVKVKGNSVKYTVQRPDGTYLAQNRVHTSSDSLSSTPFGDGLAFFAICNPERNCSGSYTVIFRNISVSWGNDSTF